MRRLSLLLVLMVACALTMVAQSLPFDITTTSVPNVVVGQSYPIFRLDSVNGFGTVSWSIISGAAPPGFVAGFAQVGQSPSSGTFCFGTQSGGAPPVCAPNTPIQSTPGPYTFTIRAVDGVGQVAARQFTLIVAATMQITSASLPTGLVGQAYGFTFQMTGGVGPFIWSLASGTLPAGFTLDQFSGVLFNPSVSTSGSFPLTILVSDTNTGASASKAFTLNLILGQLTITPTNLPPVVQGTALTPTQMTATGGAPPYKWGFATANNQGLSIDQNTGIITGVPPTAGTFVITVTVQDVTLTVVQRDLTLQVVAGLSITTASPLPNGIVGTTYNQQLAATGGQTPRTWSLVSGAPPAGIQLTAGGALTGTPSVAGSQTFTVQVRDALGFTAQKAFTLTIASVMTITSPGVFTGTVAVPFSATLVASGGLPPYRWTQNGTLPGGLQFNTSTGVISGTPDSRASFSLSFSVNDASGQFAIQQVVININLPPVPAVTVGTGTSTQPPVSVTIAAPFPADITGTLTLTFASSFGGTDDMVRFSNGTRTLNFLIPTGATQATFIGAPNAAVIPGTVAGTITLRVTAMDSSGVSILPTAPITSTIPVPPAVPVINSVVLQKVTGGINVVVTGFSNTREISSGKFTFKVSSGNELSQADFTVALTAAYTTWFSNTLANATGGQFKLTMPFTVAEGGETLVTSVQVTLTNSIGPSAAVTSQ